MRPILRHRGLHMPFIDSHIHLYDPSRPEGIPWPPKESSIYKKSFQEHFKEYAKPLTIEGVIVVEASPREIDDEWTLELAKNDPFILGVVANLQPGEEGFEQRLEAFASHPKLKGIRLRPIIDYDLTSSDLRRRLEALVAHKLTFELGAISLKKLREYTSLASEMQETSCILDHFGHAEIDGEKPRGEWREWIERFAALPNTACKLTSLIEFAKMRPPSRDPEFYQPILEFLFKAFGEDRVIYGSNWPPISMAGSYETNLGLYQHFLGDNQRASEKFFHQNAKRIYRLDT